MVSGKLGAVHLCVNGPADAASVFVSPFTVATIAFVVLQRSELGLRQCGALCILLRESNTATCPGRPCGNRKRQIGSPRHKCGAALQTRGFRYYLDPLPSSFCKPVPRSLCRRFGGLGPNVSLLSKFGNSSFNFQFMIDFLVFRSVKILPVFKEEAPFPQIHRK